MWENGEFDKIRYIFDKILTLMQQPQRHRDDRDDPDAAPKFSLHAENYEPATKKMRFEKPEYDRRSDEHTRVNGGSTYHNCKVINIVNTSPYSKDLKDLLATATSDSPPPMKQVPGSAKANSLSDPEVDEVIKTINIEEIEREYHQKKTLTTRSTRTTRVRNPYKK